MASIGLTKSLLRIGLFCSILFILLVPLGYQQANTGPSGITPIGVGLRPADVAVDPKTDRAVVANNGSNTASLVYLAKGETVEIKVGKQPQGVAIRPAQSPDDTALAIVSNSGDNTISIINMDKPSVEDTLAVGEAPSGVAVHAQRNLAVVANGGSNNVSVIDLAKRKVVDTIDVGDFPRGIAINPLTNVAVVANRDSGTVSIIDLENNKVTKTLDVPNEPDGVAINPEAGSAGIAAVTTRPPDGKGQIAVIDLETLEITFIDVGFDPIGIAINSATNVAVVVNSESNSASLVDLNKGSLTDELPVGSEPLGAAVHPDLNRALVTDNGSGKGSGGAQSGVLEIIQLSYPIPEISGVNPPNAVAGGSDFTLRINGNKFFRTSSVTFDGMQLAADDVRFIDSHHLEAHIGASSISQARIAAITVTNPDPDGGTSDPFRFPINNPAPRINRITPDTAAVGGSDFELTIEGAGFIGGPGGDSKVTFSGAERMITFRSPTQLRVQIPASDIANPGLCPVVVCNPQPDGSSSCSAPVMFTVRAAPPRIDNFSPGNGPWGMSVTINGANFAARNTMPQVLLNKQGGGTIEAPVASFTATTIVFTVPPGTDTGPITVIINGQRATSTGRLTIEPSTNFTMTAQPGTVDVIQGQSTTYAITLRSTNGFTQLANLSVSSLPASVTGTFIPSQITAGQTARLEIAAPRTQTPGTARLTISARATVDGFVLTRSETVTLNIRPITTSFLGRTVVADPLQTPLSGVTITLLGKDGAGRDTDCMRLPVESRRVVSDAAGNFAFTNLPPGCTGPQLIRYDGTTGRTATDPPTAHYAGVDLVYNIVPSQVTVSPVLIHLPRIDNGETVMVRQRHSQPQTFRFRTIPNLEVTVYPGTRFTLLTGEEPDPFPLTAIEVAVDRLPDEMPPGPDVTGFIVAFQPANATASQPVAVTFPNRLGFAPGTTRRLTTLDPTRGVMVIYGTGTVSDDGTQVIPDLNPATPGRRYGLVHFDWHCDTGDGNDSNPCKDSCCPQTFKPVDLSSGIELLRETDIALNSLRGSLSIQRTYRTLTNAVGPFGVGTTHNYGYRLNTAFPEGRRAISLVMPDGNLIPFARERDGLPLTNSTVPSMLGTVMRVLPDRRVELRWKDGTVFRFVPSSPQLGSVLESITDPNNNRISFTRNPSRPAQMTEITDPVGRKLLLSYDDADRITSISDPIGRTVQYSYNGQGMLESITDPEGGVTRYFYDAQNRLTRIINPRGITVVRNTYDERGRVTEQMHADESRTRLEYTLSNPQARVSPVLETKVTDPLGRQATYRFSSEGYIVTVTDAMGQPRIFDREAGTNLLLARRGVAPCSICGDAAAGDERLEYDTRGNVVARTDALGNRTTYTYDATFNKVTSIIDPLGNVSRFTYDERGNLQTHTDENGHTTTYRYNEVGLLIETTDSLRQRTTYSYDALGNLTTITDALGNRTTFVYDGISRRIATIDALGRRSRTTYDNLNRVVAEINAKGETVRFTYDEVGNLLTVTDARVNTTSFTYDAMNRQVTKTTPRTETAPMGRTERRSYDLNGNLRTLVDRRGQTSRFEYDALNRLIRETYEDSTVARSYDSSGRLLRVDDSAGGVFTFAYDVNGRLTDSIGPFGTVRYTYDARGRVRSRQVVGQPTVDYTYDRVGNLLTATMPQASVTFSYDERNQPLRLSRSNGIYTEYAYDAAGRPRSLRDSNGPTLLNEQRYTYDAIGNRIEYTTNIGRPLVTQPITSRYDEENRLLQRGSTTYRYDDNGNLISEIGPKATITHTWDSRNRLRSIATSAGQTTTFRYDFSGNLIQQRDTGPGLDLTQNFVLDNLTNIASQSNSNGDRFSILTGRSIDQHLAVIRPGGQVEYGLSDAINSTIAIVDQTGSIRARFFYEPFGQTDSIGESYPFQYTGRVPVSGSLYHYRARYYHPLASRFISEDPVGFGRASVNLYQYASSNPVSLNDPTGLCSWDPAGPPTIFPLGACVCFWISSTGTYARTWGWAYVGTNPEEYAGCNCPEPSQGDCNPPPPPPRPPSPPANPNYECNVSDRTVRGLP